MNYFKKAVIVALTTSSLLLQGCFAPIVIAGAGIGAAAYIIGNRRTASEMADDSRLESLANSRLNGVFGTLYRINVTVYNKIALLTGQVPDGKGKDEAEANVEQVQGIRKVINHLTVGAPLSLGERSQDSLITTNVKSLMFNEPRIKPIDVKVVTEQKKVYLFGLVSAQEAEVMVEVARRGKGVDEVVPLFEILPPDDPRLGSSNAQPSPARSPYGIKSDNSSHVGK